MDRHTKSSENLVLVRRHRTTDDVGARHAVPGGFERTTSPEHGHSMLCPYFSVRRFRSGIKSAALG